MSYKDGYVVTIRQNNQTIQEENGKCIIPFHTEYEIRLKNKTRKRALADVYIDGELATKGGLILGANDHIDLERFIANDLRKGDRFKLVPLSDHRVEDKGEPSNGEIEVVFYPEKENEAPKLTEHHHYYDSCHHHCRYTWCWFCNHSHCSCQPCLWPCNPTPKYNLCGGAQSGSNNYKLGSNIATYSAGTENMSFGGTMGASSSMSSTLGSINMCRSVNEGEAGATVHGSLSNQTFSVGSIDADKSKPVRIRVKILGKVGTSVESIKINKTGKYCTSCGQEAKLDDVFCAKCGKKLGK